MTEPSAPGVRKAVIPVAGLGTRFLPATKAVPKEMLPVVDTPAIEYIVAEAVRAGADDVVMVTGRSKEAIADHFDRHIELESALEAKGDTHRAEKVARSSRYEVHFVRQGKPHGLGHAVLCARSHVGDEPFAVLLGDDMIDERDHLLEQMMAVQAERGGSVVALMEVPPDQVDRYGCAEVGSDTASGADVVTVTGMVEKPDPAEAPSNLAVIGRYVLHPRIFEELDSTPPGRGGEIQLTDALLALATGSGPGSGVTGVVFRGRRYDTGDRLDYLKAVVQLGSEHPELGADFSAWLREFVSSADGPAS
ncbi:MAG TPA: UTP--glucose-1-phosphate uridylyltransferase GalU [Ornithinimicrobium sp.]|uniref:UTP--glucose-1-phosphate uridylyltransferase GalU n=1 Tax=Ornithinimicrobium sp. TaxID=1977084 RepID=UPI002B483D55|nr:UTP--glucose-1-phosphate uridylyltransferase GalU [Ornithinimicrobium sp.]HKJ13201.1 UTP--glucose-1-phosphate uridylyltransferase GalU [Ornithinimicrobium sp.]